jgi:hypothetical protein
MPSRRNARNKKKNNSSDSVEQQPPTPSSPRPSPSVYPSPLPDEDDFIGQLARSPDLGYESDRLAEGIGNDAEAPPLLTFDVAPVMSDDEDEVRGHQRSPVLSR